MCAVSTYTQRWIGAINSGGLNRCVYGRSEVDIGFLNYPDGDSLYLLYAHCTYIIHNMTKFRPYFSLTGGL